MSKPKLTELELITLQAKLIEIIKLGHPNAIGKSDLCKRLDQKDDRHIRLAIENLRNSGEEILFLPKRVLKDKFGKTMRDCNGKPIVYPAGYFKRQTHQEALDFIEYMRSRVIAECKIIRSVKLAEVKQTTHQFGQIPMFLS